MSSGSAPKAGLTPEAINRLVEGRQQFLSFLEKRIQSKAAAESVVAWFYRVLRNAITDYYRQREA